MSPVPALRLFGLSFFLTVWFGFAAAAEFDLDAPTARLRQIQCCERCGLGLVVNGVRPGAAVRCGSCRRVQARWADRHLYLRMYQGCPRCGAWLDPRGHAAHETVECGRCGRAQRLRPDVADFAEQHRDANLAALAYADARRAAALPGPDVPDAPSRLPRFGGEPVEPVGSGTSSDGFPPPPVSPAGSPALRPTPRFPPLAKIPVDAHRPPPTPPFDPAEPGLDPAVPDIRATSPAPPASDPEPRRADPLALAAAQAALPETAASSPATGTPSSAPAISPVPPVVTVPALTRDLFLDSPGPAAPSRSDAPVRLPSADLPAPSTAALPVPPPSGSVDDSAEDVPAAWVDGRPIPRRDVDELVRAPLEAVRREIGRVADQPEGRELLAKKKTQLEADALSALIDREIIRRAAPRMGLAPPDVDYINSRWDTLRARDPHAPAALLLKAAHDDAVAERLRLRFAHRTPIGPERARQYYRDHADEFVKAPGLSLRAIVVFRDRRAPEGFARDPRPAEMIVEEIAAELERGVRFDDLARRHDELPAATRFRAEDAATADTEPPLPPEAWWAPAVREALAGARTGAVTGPVPLANAWAFVRLDRRQAAGPAPFSEVEGEIRERLSREDSAKAFTAWLARERTRANIHRAAP